MARAPSISREQVAEAAAKLAASGETPSVRKVRELLGAGSNATVQAHLHAWQSEQPAQPVKAVDFSEGLAQALRGELAKAREAALAESAESVRRSREAQEAAEREAAALRDQLEEAEAQAAEYFKEKQHAEGRCAELLRQVETLSHAQAARESAERELAVAQAKLSILEPRAKLVDELQQRVAVFEAQTPKAAEKTAPETGKQPLKG